MVEIPHPRMFFTEETMKMIVARTRRSEQFRSHSGYESISTEDNDTYKERHRYGTLLSCISEGGPMTVHGLDDEHCPFG